jgi:hypothetical protein
VTLTRYSAHLSLTTIVCFLGTLQSIAVTFVMEHKPSAWTIGWDMNLLAAAYAVSLSLQTQRFKYVLAIVKGLISVIFMYRELCHQAFHTMFKDLSCKKQGLSSLLLSAL